MVQVSWSQEKAILRANLAGPSSEIAQCDLRSTTNQSFLVAEEAAEKMLSMWTEKMMVPVGEQHIYIHHLQLSWMKFHPIRAVLKVLFHTQLACFIL